MYWSCTARARLQALVVLTSLAVGVTGLPVSASAAEPRESAPAASAAAEDGIAERPDAVSAMVTARASGHRVEDLSKRTETTQVFATPEGSWTSEEATDPVRVRDETGAWAGIDTTLVAVDGGFEPRSTLGGLVVSDGGDKKFAALDVEGRDLGWTWPTVLPKPVIEGSSATYVDAVEDGDLVVTATPSGFRHDIVLRKAPTGPVSYRTPVVTGGPTVTETPEGGIEVTTKSGEELVTAPPPVMYDSTPNPDGDTDAEAQDVEPVGTTVTKTASGAVRC